MKTFLTPAKLVKEYQKCLTDDSSLKVYNKEEPIYKSVVEERFWPMSLWKKYWKMIRSKIRVGKYRSQVIKSKHLLTYWDRVNNKIKMKTPVLFSAFINADSFCWRSRFLISISEDLVLIVQYLPVFKFSSTCLNTFFER